MRRRTLIIGCGYLGQWAAREWAYRGGEVWGTTRSTAKADQFLKAGIVPWVWDFDDPLPPFGPDIERVLLCPSPDDTSDESYVRLYGRLIPALVQRLAPLSPGKLIYTSSTGVYSQTHGEWVDEKTPVLPQMPRLSALLMAEQAVLRASYPSTVVRLGGIYGPGRNRLAQVRSDRYVPSMTDAWVNMVHVSDAARAIDFLMNQEADKEIFNVVDTEPFLRSHMMSWLMKRLEVEMPAFSTGEASGKRCANMKIAQLGFQFAFPTYREGYESLIESEGDVRQAQAASY